MTSSPRRRRYRKDRSLRAAGSAAFIRSSLCLKPGLRVLVMTPTRELADQITQVARTYGKYLDVHSVAIVGGMPFGDQIRALSQVPDMIVGTPGRLIDHIWRGRIDLSRSNCSLSTKLTGCSRWVLSATWNSSPRPCPKSVRRFCLPPP